MDTDDEINDNENNINKTNKNNENNNKKNGLLFDIVSTDTDETSDIEILSHNGDETSDDIIEITDFNESISDIKSDTDETNKDDEESIVEIIENENENKIDKQKNYKHEKTEMDSDDGQDIPMPNVSLICSNLEPSFFFICFF